VLDEVVEGVLKIAGEDLAIEGGGKELAFKKSVGSLLDFTLPHTFYFLVLNRLCFDSNNA
jgi:hypothetical protein